MKLTCGGAPQALVSRGVEQLRSPDIEFTAWCPLDARNAFPGLDQSGVYVIAHFDGEPPDVTDPTCKEVIYIGETTGKTQSLRKRLKQFHNAALSGTAKHSGGRTYHKKFGDVVSKTYVAVFAHTNLNSTNLQNALIKYAERKLVWDYASKWGSIPTCNSV